MPGPDFDPLDGLSEDDKEYLDGHRDAFKRQAAARKNLSTDDQRDEERKLAAEAQIKATQLAHGVVPAANGHAVPAPVQTVSQGKISLMIGIPDSNGSLPATTEKFAPDWAAMKEIIAKYNGIWTVSRHEFPAQVADILGFFGKEGWPKPADSEQETFEVIVKSGRVFRTDPE